MKAGNQTLPMDTRRLANGVYFLRLEAGADDPLNAAGGLALDITDM